MRGASRRYNSYFRGYHSTRLSRQTNSAEKPKPYSPTVTVVYDNSAEAIATAQESNKDITDMLDPSITADLTDHLSPPDMNRTDDDIKVPMPYTIAAACNQT